MSQRIGFTGTQDGMTRAQIVALRRILSRTGGWFHHGDCVGADAEAHEIAAYLEGYRIILHPPSDPKKRAWCKGAHETRNEKPYLQRNRDLVDETDVLIAAPKDKQERLRSGTWSTVRYARKTGKSVYMIFPDGKLDVFIPHQRLPLDPATYWRARLPI